MELPQFTPAMTVLVIESDGERAAQTREKLLQAVLDKSIQIKAGTGNDALALIRDAKFLEPCLLVTDREGLRPHIDSVVRQIRRLFRRPKVVLYSAGASEDDFNSWKNEGLVDEFVRKQDSPSRLQSVCRRALKEYFANSILNSVRDSLGRHPNPTAKYIVIDGVKHSPASMFTEMLRGTSIGEELIEAERVLTTLSTSECMSSKKFKGR